MSAIVCLVPKRGISGTKVIMWLSLVPKRAISRTKGEWDSLFGAKNGYFPHQIRKYAKTFPLPQMFMG